MCVSVMWIRFVNGKEHIAVSHVERRIKVALPWIKSGVKLKSNKCDVFKGAPM